MTCRGGPGGGRPKAWRRARSESGAWGSRLDGGGSGADVELEAWGRWVMEMRDGGAGARRGGWWRSFEGFEMVEGGTRVREGRRDRGTEGREDGLSLGGSGGGGEVVLGDWYWAWETRWVSEPSDRCGLRWGFLWMNLVWGSGVGIGRREGLGLREWELEWDKEGVMRVCFEWRRGASEGWGSWREGRWERVGGWLIESLRDESSGWWLETLRSEMWFGFFLTQANLSSLAKLDFELDFWFEDGLKKGIGEWWSWILESIKAWEVNLNDDDRWTSSVELVPRLGEDKQARSWE